MSGLPKTNHRNEYIIVVSEFFSIWKEAFSAVSNHSALTVADKLASYFTSQYSVPNKIPYIQVKGENLRVIFFQNFLNYKVWRKQEALLTELSLMDI